MSAITNFSLGTQRLTMVIIFTIIVGGLGQFLTFPRQEDPAIVIREIVVTAFFPGMKPAVFGKRTGRVQIPEHGRSGLDFQYSVFDSRIVSFPADFYPQGIGRFRF